MKPISQNRSRHWMWKSNSGFPGCGWGLARTGFIQNLPVHQKYHLFRLQLSHHLLLEALPASVSVLGALLGALTQPIFYMVLDHKLKGQELCLTHYHDNDPSAKHSAWSISVVHCMIPIQLLCKWDGKEFENLFKPCWAKYGLKSSIWLLTSQITYSLIQIIHI